ncbi:hypothetical protein Hanom_Chr02g00113091 [Helianthus anomalus]
MHQLAFVPIVAECYVSYVQGLMQNNQAGVSLEAASLFIHVIGKTICILPSSNPTLALLLVGFTKYDDDVGGLWENECL